jgi:hypothetical protein
MSLTKQQRAVLIRMLIGLAISVVLIAYAITVNPLNYADSLLLEERLVTAFNACLIPALFLGVCIARLAKHRFFSNDAIEGVLSITQNEQTRVLQSVLQNTFEQALLATLVYTSWSVLMPTQWLSAITVAALCFTVGRILFIARYQKGAAARAIGFTLSFYPSMLMLAFMCLYSLYHIPL